MSDNRKSCDVEPGCERPASFTVTRLDTNEEVQSCRQHRTSIYRINAKIIAECQVHDGEKCTKFPFTMRMVDGRLLAICRFHNARMDDLFARRRTSHEQYKAC